MKLDFNDFGETKINKSKTLNTSAKGTKIYMSPELVKLSNGIGIGIFDAEKCDIFSLGLTFLRLLLNLKE